MGKPIDGCFIMPDGGPLAQVQNDTSANRYSVQNDIFSHRGMNYIGVRITFRLSSENKYGVDNERFCCASPNASKPKLSENIHQLMCVTMLNVFSFQIFTSLFTPRTSHARSLGAVCQEFFKCESMIISNHCDYGYICIEFRRWC